MEIKISYVLAGSKLVKEYLEGDYMSAVKNINNLDGALVIYNHTNPITHLLFELAGWEEFIEITQEEAEAIRSHLD